MARAASAGRGALRYGCALLIGAILTCPLVARATPDTDAARYQRCLMQIHDNAQAAMEAALSWIGDGGGAPAKHCLSLALLAMGNVSDAARGLESLATGRGDYGNDLRAEMLDQAGNAWLIDENAASAISDFSAAIDLATRAKLSLPTRAQFLTDRARAHLLGGDKKSALADLNMAIALQPTAMSLTLRARLERRAHDRSRAARDLVVALSLDPTYPDAFLERGRLRLDEGSIDAARRDFLQASLLAKKGPIAEAAQNEIASIDVHMPKQAPAPQHQPAPAKQP
jgi:tetratricopeptide (TPR) repeat protein